MTNEEARDAALDKAAIGIMKGDAVEKMLVNLWNAAVAHTRDAAIDEFVRRVEERAMERFYAENAHNGKSVNTHIAEQLQAVAREMKEGK